MLGGPDSNRHAFRPKVDNLLRLAVLAAYVFSGQIGLSFNVTKLRAPLTPRTMRLRSSARSLKNLAIASKPVLIKAPSVWVAIMYSKLITGH
ncbi:hypothetical protein PMI15_04054 [Polaromonas sp. CF318]|nr:hypothetical protein PMI15_04054 [Polaromonas sp. CF318]